MMEGTELILVGATGVRLRSDWREFARAPQAPGNYKDIEKINKYIQEKSETLESRFRNSSSVLLDFDAIHIGIENIHNKSRSTSVSTMIDKLLNVFSVRGKHCIIGDNAKCILRMLFKAPTLEESFWDYDASSEGGEEARLIRCCSKGMYKTVRRLLYCNSDIRYMTLEEFLFTKDERDMLLTDKLIGCDIDRVQHPIEYMEKALENFGFSHSWSNYELNHG